MEREIERAFDRLNLRIDLVDRLISKLEQRISAEEIIRRDSFLRMEAKE